MDILKLKTAKNDWRLFNQEKWLDRKNLYWRNFSEISQLNDHDHCDFCTKKISDSKNDLNACYSMIEGQGSMICENCFNDFKEIFQWKAMSKDHFINDIEPKIIKMAKSNKKYEGFFLKYFDEPLVTMDWNGFIYFEFNQNQETDVIKTLININDVPNIIDLDFS